MTEPSAFERVVQGAVIIFLGHVVGLLFSFATRIIAARLLYPSEYGLIIFGVSFLNILSLVGNLGIQEGMARSIPRTENRGAVFMAGILVTAAASSIIAIIVVVLSKPIADSFFAGRAIGVIAVFALAIPFQAMFWTLTGAFRGVEDAFSNLIVQDVVMRGSIIVLMTVAIVLGYGAFGAAVSWTISLVITVVIAFGLLRHRTSLLRPTRNWWQSIPVYAPKLIRFSIPLMAAIVVWEFMKEVDNLFLGYFHPSAAIGLYDSAFVVAQGSFLFFWAFSFLFLPVFSELDQAKQTLQMKQLYKLTTKWAITLTLPPILVLFLFPEIVLKGIFGVEYIAGANALMVLLLGIFTHVVTGPNESALTAIGSKWSVSIGALLALIINLAMNIILIPRYYITGAAIATGGAYAILSTIYAYSLYKQRSIHPFSTGMVKTLLIGVGLMTPAYILFKSVMEPTFWSVVFFGIVFYIVHLSISTALILEAEDRQLLSPIIDRLPFTVPETYIEDERKD